MNIHQTRNINNSNFEWGIKLVLFVTSPFLAFVTSLLNPNSKSSYFIFFSFGVLFCWHMNPTGADRYDDLQGMMEYINQNHFTTNEIIDQIKLYFSFSPDATKELYMNVLIWLSGLFSNNVHLVFAIAAIPWLFFFLKSLKKITSLPQFKSGSIYCLIVLLLFVFPRDIITLQNPRFTTGVWFIIYSIIHFFSTENKKWKYVLLILLTPLIHSGFIPFAILFPILILSYRFERIVFIAFVISIIISSFTYSIVSNINIPQLLLLPTEMSFWIERYLSEEYYNKFVANTGTGFYMIQVVFETLTQIVYLIIPFSLWTNRHLYHQKDKKFIMFYIGAFALINLISYIPVLGERYYWIIQILSIYVFFKLLYPKYKWWLWLCLFACSFAIVKRYFHQGALSSSVPIEIFYAPTPYLIWEYLRTSITIF